MRWDQKHLRVLHVGIEVEWYMESLCMIPEDMMAAGDRNGRMKAGLNMEVHMNSVHDEAVDTNIDLLLQASQHCS